MVKIGSDGFEFDNLEIHSVTLTRSSTSMIESSKRIQVNIDYSSTSLTGTPHIITITNTTVDAKDSIICNIISSGSGHEEIFVNVFSIINNEIKLVLKALGPAITDTVNVVILVLT